MHEADVVRIVKEELGKNSNRGEATIQIEVRIGTEIASRIFRPALSTEQWGIFLTCVQAEPVLHRINYHVGEPIVVIKSPQCFAMFGALEKAYMFLLNTIESTSDYFQKNWPKELLLQTACSLSVARDTIRSEYENAENVGFSSKDAKRIVNCIRCAQVGIAGEILMNEYVREANTTLKIMKATLASQ